jgi:hypothetical protein
MQWGLAMINKNLKVAPRDENAVKYPLLPTDTDVLTLAVLCVDQKTTRLVPPERGGVVELTRSAGAKLLCVYAADSGRGNAAHRFTT